MRLPDDLANARQQYLDAKTAENAAAANISRLTLELKEAKEALQRAQAQTKAAENTAKQVAADFLLREEPL